MATSVQSATHQRPSSLTISPAKEGAGGQQLANPVSNTSANVFEVFICSEAGKPIYCFNKSRDDEFVVTLMGVCQALINFYIDSEKDLLRSITTVSGIKITFAVKTPLIIVVVTHKLSPIDPQLVINQVQAQIVSVLTMKTLKSVFEQRPTFDLRRLLSGSEKLVDTLIEDGLLGNPLTWRRRHLQSIEGDLSVDPKSNSKYGLRSPQIFGYISSVPSPPKMTTQTSTSSATSAPSTPLPGASLNLSAINEKKRAFGGRVLIPVKPLSLSIRDTVTNIMFSAISSTPSSVLFGVLFQVKVSPSISPGFDQGEQLKSDLQSESSKDEDGGGDQNDNTSRPSAEPVPEVEDINIEAINLEDCSNCSMRDPNTARLVAIVNYSPRKTKLHPLDMQLLQGLVIASEGQLSAAESLWLPICLPRVDPGAFIHGHISYLNQTVSSPTGSANPVHQKLCLLLLTADREDFSHCQQIRDNLSERLNKVTLNSPQFSDLEVSQTQAFSYQSGKPYSMIYKSWPHFEVGAFHELVSYVGNRMIKSNLKLFWLMSDKERIVLLGWRTPSFVLFAQFDATITHGEVISAASNIVKWIKKEEDKIKIKDYM